MRGAFDGTVIVPTVGRSPCLEDCLRSVRGQRGARLRLVCVGPGDALSLPALAGADTRVEVPEGTGFASAVDRGWSEADTELVGVLNDDAILAEDWWGTLAEVCGTPDGPAAVQGLNLDGEGRRIDGAGIRWNRWWQAVQVGRGAPADAPLDDDPFGVSATGAVFLRRALEEISGPEGAPFDRVLESWYEDVDLSARLRRAGHRCAFVPGALLRHLGSASGAALGAHRWALLYGNRWLVLARHLGRAFARERPRILLRDVLDALHAGRRGEDERRRGIRGGWKRARLLLGRYRHAGAPTLTSSDRGRGR